MSAAPLASTGSSSSLESGGATQPTSPSFALAQALVCTLPAAPVNMFNPWTQQCAYDLAADAPQDRLLRLAHHLDCAARVILVGEAPGYQGCRYSGIAFSSERLLLAGEIPRIARLDQRLSLRRNPFSEPSATIVWKQLYRLGIAEHTILWNAVQLHPFMTGRPWSNRTPTDAELALGVGALRLLAQAFPQARLIAVGKKAEKALNMIGIPFHACIRHPANGGAMEFATGLTAALDSK